MSKLTWEWGDKPDEIIIRKPKGRLTLDEIMDYLNSRDMIMTFGEGALCAIAWRTTADGYGGWDIGHDKPEGDAQNVFVLVDDSRCFCGNVLHMQYCPECGHKLTEGKHETD